MSVNWSRFRTIGPWAIANVGISLGICFFIFQVSQTWFDEGTHSSTLRWLFPGLAALIFFFVHCSLFFLCCLLLLRPPRQQTDPYKQLAAGVISYGRILHEDKRDPALMRLRNNMSLTLHVLGFQRERSELGKWSLEAAQYVDDRMAIISILVDDLGWAKYLQNDPAGIENIRKGIQFSVSLAKGEGDPNRTLLEAKAHRHLGVILNATTNEVFSGDEFDIAEKLLTKVQKIAPIEVRLDQAHIKFARALAAASFLNVNTDGQIRKTDKEAVELLQNAIALVRGSKDEFLALSDQGRYAKAIVLEVRLLEANHDLNAANQLEPLRDRAVKKSVWSRPEGQIYISGR